MYQTKNGTPTGGACLILIVCKSSDQILFKRVKSKFITAINVFLLRPPVDNHQTVNLNPAYVHVSRFL